MATVQTTGIGEEAARVIAALPPDAQKEVLDFALFLQARAAVDDAWDEALESTTPEQVARIRARIASQKAQATPLFDEQGKLATSKPPTDGGKPA